MEVRGRRRAEVVGLFFSTKMKTKQEERKAFNFLRSYFRQLQELPDDKRLRLYDSICSFSFDGHEPDNLEDWIERAVWEGIKGTLEPSRRGWCDKMGIPYEGGMQPPCQGGSNTPYQQKREEEERGVKKKEEKKEVKFEIVLPFDSDNFQAQWQLWKQYKKQQHRFSYKAPPSEQAALTNLANMAQGQEKKAIDIIHYTMANGWKGFVAPKPKEDLNGMINVADL